MITSSCEDYLNVPPEAAITEDKVFSTYLSFQGFEDQMYQYIVDPNLSTITVGHNLTGETIAKQGWNTSQGASTGNYLNLTSGGGRSNFKFFDDGTGVEKGIWAYSWKGIRRANIALQKLNLLVNATQQEKDQIEGQAYFFRAYFHFELLRAYGSIPYINTVLSADEQLKFPRFYEYKGKYDYQACTEFIVEDLQKAADLLPPSWNNTNTGRVTKGASYALMAKALLYAGSPLMNENSRNSATYDSGYMTRAAEAAGEVLKMVDTNIYDLVTFDKYLEMFAKTDGNIPYSKEIIFQKVRTDVGAGEINNFVGRLYTPNSGLFGGNAICEAVTQNFVDIFEMADGTKYKPGTLAQGGYDYDNTKRWNNRDPRFRKSIYVDGDMAGIHATTRLEMFNGGSTMADGNTLSPYIVHKFWPVGANKKDAQWNTLRVITPLIRLADVYLIYAEAVYNSSNDVNSTATNYSLTALQAINKVRARAGASIVTGLSVYDNNFNNLVKYERDVELCFEGHRWYDLRRWKIKPDATLYRMSFDKNYTTFNRVVIQPFVFTDRNYWLPFPINLTYAYEGFPQNPGW
ncbi:RagB/SusD family nutrient uptake outer membrane protein [Flavobacterium flevense]|uniref:RagB/SusD family nutrient uptake outer membrane protein n=1 Tax=Flavobacterium flevense TaxID=983 RepID=UPI0013566178|nr:RagB/SusD family nutrient uptake outer membrane protein [Flavobacterium flevense]